VAAHQRVSAYARTVGPAGGAATEHDRRRREILASADFRHLVARRWKVCLTMMTALSVLYYGYILLIAFDKPMLSRRIGETTTLAIPLGIGVILGAWALTAGYVVWANRHYDGEVARLRAGLKSK